jgi:hypothetical protein
MTDIVVEPSTPSRPEGLPHDLVQDRRRPGRAPVNPNLLPLLRRGGAGAVMEQQAEIDLPDVEWESEDSMKPARGIVFGLMLSLPIWALVFIAYHEIAVHLAAHS